MTSTEPTTSLARLQQAFPAFEQVIRGSTLPDPDAWLALVSQALSAGVNRSENIAALNLARAAAERAALDAAVVQVIGPLPLHAHGAAGVVGRRIQSAVRRGEISSTFGSSNEYEGGHEPSPRALRMSLSRLDSSLQASTGATP